MLRNLRKLAVGDRNRGAPAGSKSAALQGPTQARANAAAAPDASRSVVRKPAPNGNWSWDGGTAITVAPGETVDAIARRYGVPASVIMQSNNITSPAIIYPGQRLVIPRYTHAPVGTAAAPATRPASPRTCVRVCTCAGGRRDPGEQCRRTCGRRRRHAEQDCAALQQARQRDRQGQQHPVDHHAQCRRPSRDTGRTSSGREAHCSRGGRSSQAGTFRGGEGRRARADCGCHRAAPTRWTRMPSSWRKVPAHCRSSVGRRMDASSRAMDPRPTASRTMASTSPCRRTRR